MSSDKKSMSKQELLALGLMNTLPALLGAAIAGPEAGAGGAAASQQGNQVLMDFVKADREEEAASQKAQQEADLKRELAQESQMARQEAQKQAALDRNALYADRKAEREDARALKRDDLEKSLAVPGYKRTGEVLAKPEEAMKLRKATANAEQLAAKLDRLKELVGQVGSFERGGTAGQEMESLATEIQLLSKSPEMYELGVLTGPDLSLLQKITADPTSLDSLFTRDSTRQKQIDTQAKSVRDKLLAATKASGYVPEQAAPQQDPKARLEQLRAKYGKR